MTYLLIAICASVSILPQQPPPGPYADPAQLEVPAPKHSFLKIPWRAYLETKSGDEFLRGVGVNYNVPGKSGLAVRLLAESGFRAFRIETGWGSVRWEEDGLHEQDRLRWLLESCRARGIRPTLLLNANHGVPCPNQSWDRPLAEDAPKASRSVKFADTADIVPGRTGISNLTDYWAAEVLITKVNKVTGECELSKPLPKDLKKGQEVRLMTLKYLPLHPAGTKEFDETAGGWVRFALLICKQAIDAGIEEFDVEIWNELTFGIHYLNVNDYYDPPKVELKTKDMLNKGGHFWELARRTVEAVKQKYPKVRCIWGYSNTTFFHTPIEALPPGTDGQSYHPYGTGTRTFPKDEDYPKQPELNLDGFTPRSEFRISEGWAHTFIKTESLMRLLNPETRRRHPPGVERFFHYMTEHGVAPPEAGVTTEESAWRLKTLCALRSYCLWLNKGIDTLHYYSAYEDKPLGMGLLPPNLEKLPADSKFDAVATPPMKALRNLTRAFHGSVPLEAVRPLQVAVNAAGPTKKVFEGKKALQHSDVFAFLPFQATEKRHIIAVYVSTYDAMAVMPEEPYRLVITGCANPPTTVKVYDPVLDRTSDLVFRSLQGGALQLDVSVTDYPRILIVE